MKTSNLILGLLLICLIKVSALGMLTEILHADIHRHVHIQGCIQKFLYSVIMKYALTFGITHSEATQRVIVAKLTRLTHNSDTTAPSSIELYHLQFSLQANGPETLGYTLVNIQSKTL
jgi:hypothetical protein